MVNFFGLEWHVYGLILGASIWLGWELIAYQARQRHISITVIEKIVPWVILGGVVGARLYHVITDWPLYALQPWTAIYIWQGGLSVIGAVIGGGLVLAWWLWRQHQLALLPRYLDLAAFGLPLAQVLGRWGNYFNHELYGKPSTLPWAVSIPPEFRVQGYQNFETFHPLFAYEAAALLVFWLTVWGISRHHRGPVVGSGLWFASYVAYYTVVRFGLDFWRLTAAPLGTTGLTVNQGVMVVLLIPAVWFIYRKYAAAST